MGAFPFHIDAVSVDARTGRLVTPRGIIQTPAFMPLATAGAVKALMLDQVRSAGAQIVLGNTYHLMLRPGAERVARLGGVHAFMNWDGPILTDSGGFQVMSLSKIRTLREEGVTFRSHIDGSAHELTPERAIEIQADLLQSDIVMQLDECPALPARYDKVAAAVELSLRWAERCKHAFGAREKQALFGIVQGGTEPALRERSANGLIDIGFDGYAIGGLAVGEGHDAMLAAIDCTAPLLPADRPRYLMGVGKPIDIVEAALRGIDMFDCVVPTRSGRHGQAWTDAGPLNIRNARHQEDTSPLDAESDCPASRDYSKAYLHHLFRAEELLGPILLSWHNVAYYQRLMRRIRAAIAGGRMPEFVERFRAGLVSRA